MGRLILSNLVNIVFSAIMVVVIIAGLLASFGWAAIYAPLLVACGGLGLYWGVRRFITQRERQRRKLAASRRHTAELEAELGIPLLLVGACPCCGEPLLDAKYCSACRQGLVAPHRPPAICDACQTRNLDDATYCGAYGARMRTALNASLNSHDQLPALATPSSGV